MQPFMHTAEAGMTAGKNVAFAELADVISQVTVHCCTNEGVGSTLTSSDGSIWV